MPPPLVFSPPVPESTLPMPRVKDWALAPPAAPWLLVWMVTLPLEPVLREMPGTEPALIDHLLTAPMVPPEKLTEMVPPPWL